jgi:hypothetical protein
MAEGVDADVLSDATAEEVKKAKMMPARGVKASVRFGTLVKVQIATNRLARLMRKAPSTENTDTGLDTARGPPSSDPLPASAPAEEEQITLPNSVPVEKGLSLTLGSSGGSLSSQSSSKQLMTTRSSGGPNARSDWLTSVAFAGSTHGLLAASKTARTNKHAIKRKALHVSAALSYLAKDAHESGEVS